MTEIETQADDTYQSRRCEVELGEIIDGDLEQFLDLISERAFGNELLMDVNYRVLEVKEDGITLVLEVSGDTSMIEEMEAGA